MMTREMEQGLADLGYTKAQRDAMKPEEAQAILTAQTKAPVDESTAKARAKALEEKPAAERKVEQKAAPEPETPAPPAIDAGGAAPDTSWVSAVPENVYAWVPYESGAEKWAWNKDWGFDSTGNDKEVSNTRGVFQKPDGTVVVATIKKTSGELVEQGEGNKAKKWTTLLKDGWTMLGYSRGAKEKKVYREYSKEQWAEIEPQLKAKTEKANAEAPPAPTLTPAESTGA